MIHSEEELERVLAELAAENGWSREDCIKALKWITNPTVRPVVSVKEFIESPYYMGAKNEDGTSVIFPEVLRELEEMNNGEYDEVVLTGSIGSAKTTCALYSIAYQLYVLSCYEKPHELYGLDPSSEIVFIFQSLRLSAAKEVDYERFRAMIEKCQYFKDYFMFDKDLKSELKFPHRIYVRPVSSKDTAAIGQNVFGGIIDEINFMQLIENSKSNIDGGAYDQAKALYDSISKRRKSRFSVGGKLPGLLCMVSSKRYPGQFTDRKTEERNADLARYGKSSIYVYDKRGWEIKPAKYFSGQWFNVFIGDEGHKPRILADGETLPGHQAHLSMAIPEDFRKDFEGDMMGSLRDIAGVSTLALHPFIPDREAVVACVRNDAIVAQPYTVDFKDIKLKLYKDQIINPSIERFVHCDLAISGDCAGVAIGHVTGFSPIARGQDQYELLPSIYADVLLQVKAPKGGEILLYKVREVIYALKDMGMNIRWITFDQYQSRDSMQLLRQKGYAVGYQSIDINSTPYDFLKNAIYDGRLDMPHHPICELELTRLEKDVKKGKVDHPAGFSKDVSDALAGVVYGLTMRRETWAKHGIGLGTIPKSIMEVLAKKKADTKETVAAEDAIKVA